MAETQEKRTEGSASADSKSTEVDNKKNTAGQTSSEIPGAKEILQQAKETAGQAYGKVTEQASSQIVTQKDNLAQGLSSIADGIRRMGENLRGAEQQTPIAGLTARYGDSLASQVEQVSDYLEKKDLRELVRDIEVFARRNPAVFIGGAFALGVAAARFLKSGNPNQALMRRPHRSRQGIYIPDKSEGVYLPEDLGKKVGLSGGAPSGNDKSTTASGTTSENKTSVGDPTSGSGGQSSDVFSP